MFVENTAAFLADFGVPSSFTSGLTYTPLVIFDEPDKDVLGHRALSADYKILFRTADLPGLVTGASITVRGQLYQVIDVLKIDDGVFSEARLQI